MTDSELNRTDGESRREHIRIWFATVIVVLLLLGMGFIGSRLHEIEEQLRFREPTASATPATLPADTVAKGRAVYVPAYSHIYASNGKAMLLATTLSVRNTDPEHPIRVDRVSYFGDDGTPLREMVEQTLVLAPMQTAPFLVEQQDRTSGSGANFVVEWSAREEINRPIIEAVMVGDGGLSFKSRGEPIDRR